MKLIKKMIKIINKNDLLITLRRYGQGELEIITK